MSGQRQSLKIRREKVTRIEAMTQTLVFVLAAMGLTYQAHAFSPRSNSSPLISTRRIAPSKTFGRVVITRAEEEPAELSPEMKARLDAKMKEWEATDEEIKVCYLNIL